MRRQADLVRASFPGWWRDARSALIATAAVHDRWLHKNPVKITSPEQVLRILEAAA